MSIPIISLFVLDPLPCIKCRYHYSVNRWCIILETFCESNCGRIKRMLLEMDNNFSRSHATRHALEILLGGGRGASQSGALCSVFQIFLAVRYGINHQIVWVGVCRRGHQTLTLFKTKIAHFGHFATPL